MAEITLDSVPGADDVAIDGTSLNAVDALRSECLSSGVVSCDWNALHARLINHDVSRAWWFLTESERRSITGIAVSKVINKIIWYYRRGENGEWCTMRSVCTYNATIRFQKFGTPVGWNDCYWKYNKDDSKYFCYVPEQYFGLPTVHVNTGSHAMCGIHVVEGIDDLNNWVVFQYACPNIRPGNSQMPNGSHVLIQDPFPYTGAIFTCVGFDSNIIAEFDV